MQQDTKYALEYPDHKNQIITYNDNYCRRLLARCENGLNSYIKFLVPPQESCCQQLKRLLELCDNEALWSPQDDTGTHFVGETHVENEDEIIPKSLFTPSKICRFAEETEDVPSYDDVMFHPEPSAQNVDEDSVVYIPEPFGTDTILEKTSKFVFDNPPKYTSLVMPTEQKSSVIFLPEPTQLVTTPEPHSFSPKSPKFVEKFSSSPLAKAKFLKEKIEEKFSPTRPKLTSQSSLSGLKYSRQTSVGQRPKYTTQVSTISQKSFTGRKFTTQVSTISLKSNTVSLYSCWPPPIGIILISILEVILFVVNEKTTTNGKYGVIADALMFNPFRRKEAWRFITYLFVHIGIQHLLFNLGVQVFLGVILEMVHQRWRVLTIYFAGILAGSLGASVFNPRVKLAGASGGVYSLITAHIVTVILKWKQVQYPATQLLAFLIVIITDISTGIYSFYHTKIEDVSYIAHVCGALAGLLVGFPVLRNLSPDKKIRWFQYIGLVIYLILFMVAVIWNIAATSYFPKQEI